MSLNILVFLGSARASTPPHPARLGLRVARACVAHLQQEGHHVTLIDPLDVPLDPVFTPHFAFAKGQAPAALANLLNHFASSLFAFKPSAIVTYSAGQWGGARAAMGMRAYLGNSAVCPRPPLPCAARRRSAMRRELSPPSRS